MAEHSPEPWEFDPKHLAIYSADGNVIADFWDVTSANAAGNAPTREEAEANVALAMAAPETVRQRDELREACKAALELPNICDEIGYGGDVNCVRDGHGMLKTTDGELVKAHTQGGFPARKRIVKMLRAAIASVETSIQKGQDDG